MNAVAQAASRIRSGDETLILAGGVESASTSPWRFWPPVDGAEPVRYTRAPFAPHGFEDPDMGVAADDLARIRGIGRERQDAYAARSFARAAACDFSAEIVTVNDVELVYIVTETTLVGEYDLWVIQPTRGERLTLMTCDITSYNEDGYSRRAVVIAEPA